MQTLIYSMIKCQFYSLSSKLVNLVLQQRATRMPEIQWDGWVGVSFHNVCPLLVQIVGKPWGSSLSSLPLLRSLWCGRSFRSPLLFSVRTDGWETGDVGRRCFSLISCLNHVALARFHGEGKGVGLMGAPEQGGLEDFSVFTLSIVWNKGNSAAGSWLLVSLLPLLLALPRTWTCKSSPPFQHLQNLWRDGIPSWGSSSGTLGVPVLILCFLLNQFYSVGSLWSLEQRCFRSGVYACLCAKGWCWKQANPRRSVSPPGGHLSSWIGGKLCYVVPGGNHSGIPDVLYTNTSSQVSLKSGWGHRSPSKEFLSSKELDLCF